MRDVIEGMNDQDINVCNITVNKTQIRGRGGGSGAIMEEVIMK